MAAATVAGAASRPERAVAGDAPAIGDGGGLEEREVAADPAGGDDPNHEEGNGSGSQAQGEGGRTARSDEEHCAGGGRGVPGETCLQGAAQGLACTATSQGPCGRCGACAAFGQEWDEPDDDRVDRESGEGEGSGE